MQSYSSMREAELGVTDAQRAVLAFLNVTVGQACNLLPNGAAIVMEATVMNHANDCAAKAAWRISARPSNALKLELFQREFERIRALRLSAWLEELSQVDVREIQSAIAREAQA